MERFDHGVYYVAGLLKAVCCVFLAGGFLIPYFIMLIAEGMPLLYLELAVGQRMRQGSIGAWKIISPYLCGVGMFSVSIFIFKLFGTIG